MTKTTATYIGSISIFLWGTLALLTKFTGEQIPPFQMIAMAFTIAFLLMNIRWWSQGHSGVQFIRQPILVWCLGIGGLFGYHFAYFKAMTLAPAIEVSLIAYLWPLLIVVLSSFLPSESFKTRYLIGAIIAMVGCWLLIGLNGNSFEWIYIQGYITAFLCALIWSSYSVLSRLVKTVPTDSVGWFCGLTALLSLVAHLLLEETRWPKETIAWLGIVGLGLGPVGIAFFTWDYGVKHGNIQLLGILSYGAPLISVILLIIFGFGEATMTVVLASICIVIGSLIAGVERKSFK